MIHACKWSLSVTAEQVEWTPSQRSGTFGPPGVKETAAIVNKAQPTLWPHTAWWFAWIKPRQRLSPSARCRLAVPVTSQAPVQFVRNVQKPERKATFEPFEHFEHVQVVRKRRFGVEQGAHAIGSSLSLQDAWVHFPIAAWSPVGLSLRRPKPTRVAQRSKSLSAALGVARP